MAKAAYGVESLEIGAPGANGTAGTTLTKVAAIAEGSVTFNIPEQTTNDITVEDVDGTYASLPSAPESPTITFGTVFIDGPTLVSLLGGAYNSTTKVYTPPAQIVPLNQTVVITTRPLNNTKLKFTFPLVQLTSAFNSTFTRTELVAITMNGKVLIPYNSATPPVAQPYYTITEVAA